MLITGGASPLALALARRLVQRGASISLLDRQRQPLSEAADELRPLVRKEAQQIEIVTADVAVQSDVQQAIGDLTRRSGPCDVLITAADALQPGYFQALDEQAFRRLMDINYFGTLYAIQAVLPAMTARRAGALVAVSSVAAMTGLFGYSAYAPTKFAVRGLMESLRMELKPYNIATSLIFMPALTREVAEAPPEAVPLETARLAAALPALPVDQIARTVVRGVQKGRFMITAPWQSRVLLRLGGLGHPLLQRFFDRKVAQAQREQRIQELNKQL